MSDIQIIATGEVLSRYAFNERYPTKVVPDECLSEVGARLYVPPVTAAGLAEVLTAEATRLRWVHETGGIDFGGHRIATGIDDQNRIASVVANAQAAGLSQVDFKAASGWVSLDLEQLSAIASAIACHVQACFSAERLHHQALAALAGAEDVAGLRAYDLTEGWPA